MPTITPGWTDNVNVVSAAVLALGSTARGTLDLRTKKGADLFIKIGRGGTTGLTNGVNVLIRPVLNNDTATAGGAHPGGIDLLSSTVAAVGTTVSSDSAAGQAVLTVASGTGIVAGDLLCIQDSGGGVTRLEWQRVSKISGGTVTLDRFLQFAHTAAQADTVRDQSDVFPPIPIRGGTLWEVIFDYGDDAAGESVTVQCKAQTYDSDTVA